LDIGEDVRKLLEAPVGHSICSVELGLTVHGIRLPIGYHRIGQGKDNHNPHCVEDVFEDLAEPITLIDDLLDHDLTLETQKQESLSAT